MCKQLAQGCTRQRGGRDLNPRPVGSKSIALSTRPPGHAAIVLPDFFYVRIGYRRGTDYHFISILNITLNTGQVKCLISVPAF